MEKQSFIVKLENGHYDKTILEFKDDLYNHFKIENDSERVDMIFALTVLYFNYGEFKTIDFVKSFEKNLKLFGIN